MKAVAVFLVTACLDVVWHFYIAANAEKRSGRAAALSSVLVMLGAFNTLSIVGNPALIIPAALGAFIGTFIAVEVSRGVG